MDLRTEQHMLNFCAFFSDLLRWHKHGVLSLTQTDSDNLVIGSSRSGRKSDLTLKIEATGARPGETVAMDEQGQMRVLGRKPEVAVDNTK